jgi:hypothetical protein
MLPLLRTLIVCSFTVSASAAAPAQSETQITWQSDYHAAVDAAEGEHKFALLWFYDSAVGDGALQQTIDDSLELQEVLTAHFSAAKLPVHAEVTSQGQTLRLLDHPAFADLRRGAGLAILDMTEAESPLFRQVVSIYPLGRRSISREQLMVLLALPRGTLTQRTLIFAVRTHPEHPASTEGHLSQLLTRETENHAWHQASIGLQGHHNWDARFHAIGAQLPGGLAAREVCAESWPGQSLIDAAEECVHSWRQSSGHWEAVQARHALYAYDMKRGANGVWYAAGIFAGRLP